MDFLLILPRSNCFKSDLATRLMMWRKQQVAFKSQVWSGLLANFWKTVTLTGQGGPENGKTVTETIKSQSQILPKTKNLDYDWFFHF